MTHLSLMPKDTWRVVVPALQVSPSSAHFEKPLGQSTAKAGDTAPPSMATAANMECRRTPALVLDVMLSPREVDKVDNGEGPLRFPHREASGLRLSGSAAFIAPRCRMNLKDQPDTSRARPRGPRCRAPASGQA
jgi:hypothetical protein